MRDAVQFPALLTACAPASERGCLLLSNIDLRTIGDNIENTGDTKIFLVCRVSTANDDGAGRGESISRSKKSHVFRDLAAGKRKRMRSRRHEADENHCLVDFFTSEGIFNLPASVFLELRLRRRGQSLADAGTHAVRKARRF